MKIWNMLMTRTNYEWGEKFIVTPMPEPHPVPDEDLFWMAVMFDDDGDLSVQIDPMPVDMGPKPPLTPMPDTGPYEPPPGGIKVDNVRPPGN
jgi:hypothetical protein